MADCLIYGLIDPRNGQIRYIGKSMSGLSRPKKHANPSKLQNDFTHKANWIRGLLDGGQRCEIEVLERGMPQTLAEAEQFWIGYYRMVGADLTNLTAGGEGAPGHKQSLEHRRKIGLGNKGKGRGSGPRAPLSEETKQKISEANRGKVRTPEARARISAVQIGRTASLTTRQKMSIGHIGKARTRGMTGRKHSEETKLKMSLTQLRLAALKEISNGERPDT